MSYLDAALTVLREARRPMTDREITDEALRRGLIDPAGKTPRATLSARLYVEAKRGESSPIVRVYEPGPTRARRGSVRWQLRAPEAAFARHRGALTHLAGRDPDDLVRDLRGK